MKTWKLTLVTLLLITALLVIGILQIPDGNFHLIACNVGQGDATLIVFKNLQILVDGGPDNKVLTCLGKYMPFWDRELELVISTHPDSDHFFGLIEVFKKYKVDNYLANSITISKPEYKVLENTVGGSGAVLFEPYQGQVVRLGLIQLDILAPMAQISNLKNQISNEEEVTDQSTNKYSIVNLVSFGKFKALLTGDMDPEVSDSLAKDWSLGHVDYIKISHHGSKNGTTDNLLKVAEPKLAVISVGKNNYGQPAPEVLQMLEGLRIKYYRTDKSGDVEVVSDGEKIRLRQDFGEEDVQKN